MARQSRSLTRKIRVRQPRPKCIIFCEGKNTEPQYFRAFRSQYRKSLFEVVTVEAVGVPKTLLEKALTEKNRIAKGSKRGRSYSENDQVWIAFDRDEHDEIAQTINNATANGIGVAYSNPCFELWLILHYADYDRPDSRHSVQKACDKIVPSYNLKSGKTGDFSDIVEEVEHAEARARDLVKRREEEGMPMSAPCCTVFRLTETLRAT